jgi:hypothetical protein
MVESRAASNEASTNRSPEPSARLILGPMLRYVDERRATVWVETSRPCRVQVLSQPNQPNQTNDMFSADTFSVHGHHFALVDIDGLEPGSSTEYTVDLDGERCWPEPGTAFPPSRIRTLAPGPEFRLAFGSCRTSVRHDAASTKRHGVDVLRAYGHRLRTADDADWPDALLMLGDQVYADEPSEEMRDFIAARRSLDVPPHAEIADFEEYTAVYRIAWSEPTIRWLLSTVPSMMIFDDHDIRDDWNTSDVWRRQMAMLPWWPRRIVGGLASYWVYQHLGNLSPDERATHPTWQAVRSAEGDGGEIVDAFAADADANPAAHRWSYSRDFGPHRLAVLDSRCGRVLTPGRRAMLDHDEWQWFDRLATGDVDHLLIGTSLPYLLPRGLHELEQWNEAVGDGGWGRQARRTAEKLRQGIDLEHWAAFHDSFAAMAKVLREIATGQRGRAPATVTFLSGDVHYSYLMQADLPEHASRVYQAVCSPIRNPLSRGMRYANTAASFGVAGAIGRLLARTAGLHERALDWSLRRGPIFDNALATVELAGRRAQVVWDGAEQPDDADMPTLRRLVTAELSTE